MLDVLPLVGRPDGGDSRAGTPTEAEIKITIAAGWKPSGGGETLTGVKVLLFFMAAPLVRDNAAAAHRLWRWAYRLIDVPTKAKKLEYIHSNPVRAGICTYPEEYQYSSAKYYHSGVDDFGMLSHYSGN